MKRSSLLTTVALLTMASPAFAIEKADVLNNYANIAAAKYGDSLITAQRLQTAQTGPSRVCQLLRRSFQKADIDGVAQHLDMSEVG